ncbi:glutaredoxin domain-containing cysteine-rich protein CG12206-like [Toxorhynchites rutilus septentrionalis]|uniref:glutaredoxin domain-containing cysteine-rich protein CG12206-like n=1 Tax=Toxorhynchites rutilus septentrionalis TaxID=329112 RepID=UPI0024788DB1|nr:glutaredoxin domain-containing cysteine-rich protein CG12206-like [Toxorhynchites rutilus septentrionalis]XP_055641433.1 glutaredoxin domain-containing cysteine-rich protein CG12206-like [Toxorhynchites rutilus septentrionalis]
MDAMASLQPQTHKLTSIQLSAETTVYSSLDPGIGGALELQHKQRQKQNQKPTAEKDSSNSNNLPPVVERLLSVASASASEKVVLPQLEKEERAETSKSSVTSKSESQQQSLGAQAVSDSPTARSSARAGASAVALASSSPLETVREEPTLPVSTDQDSHVVRIQIVQNKTDRSEIIQNNHGTTAVISLSNKNSAPTVNNQCKAKVSIVSFGPFDQEHSRSSTPIEMVQKQTSPSATPTVKAGDLDVNNSTYLYYMSSGQCSPSDTLDSGTCSDIEVTPPPLPKKMFKSPQPKQNSPTTLMMIDGNSPKPADKHNQEGYARHQRSVSYNISDSDESESSLSCDSLNFSQLCGNVTTLGLTDSISSAVTIPCTEAHSPLPPTLDESAIIQSESERENGGIESLKPIIKKHNIVSILPDSLLKDIRERSGVTSPERAAGLISSIECTPPVAHSPFPSFRDEIITTRSLLMEKINNLNSVQCAATDGAESVSSLSVTPAGAKQCKSISFENDKFYKFHINEHLNLPDLSNGTNGTSCASSVVDDDESFAGYKDLTSGHSTIRSHKGTVRGVKNRVRNGIATFLQMQQANIKNYKEKDAGKVVVYTTSMGIVRETYTKCANVKQILKTLLVKFEERDVFMSNDYQQEIKDRMQSEAINVPQLFVDGQHVGDAESVERLNESGELRKMLKPYRCLESSFTCKVCGGYRLLPCPSCGGSKKSIHRNHFTTEFIALKCMNCDEVGLVKCHNC